MIVNTGNTDRFFRFLFGLALIINMFILNLNDFWTLVFALIGFGNLFISITGFCLMYKLLGFNTLFIEKKN